MTGAKFDIEKFDGTGDFGLWRIKICALLIQHGCEAALEVLPADMEAQTKAELNKKAHSAVILCLGNKVLRVVTGETIPAGVWSKLETLYMTKSLANKFYLKKKFYTFYMPAGRKISEHIEESLIMNYTSWPVAEAVLASQADKQFLRRRAEAYGLQQSYRCTKVGWRTDSALMLSMCKEVPWLLVVICDGLLLFLFFVTATQTSSGLFDVIGQGNNNGVTCAPTSLFGVPAGGSGTSTFTFGQPSSLTPAAFAFGIPFTRFSQTSSSLSSTPTLFGTPSFNPTSSPLSFTGT
ncbi:hypothetical protein Tco_0853942 [Tanacetum coccineum]